MEMLVVLAILSLLVGLTWPSFHRLLGRSRVVDAAKQVRTELGEARLRAIESGKPQVFRFQLGTGVFEVRPKEEETAGPAVLKSALEQMSDESDDTETVTGTGTCDTAAYDRYLPEGMSFVGQHVAQEPTAEDEDGLVGLSTAEVTEQQAWSKPIIFYPNGRTSNARIRVTDGEQYAVDVSLRGLTGTVRVGPALRIELASETSPLGEGELDLDGELDTASSLPDTTFRSEGFLGPAPVEAQR
jgi:type II secretory pathway pseudopilin PulG